MESYELNYMQKSQLRKRIESFAWRVGMIALVALLNASAANLGIFNLPLEAQTIIGLILAEISKAVSNKLRA
jgi:ABC-type uncharacterized transport system permease subunit